MRARRRLRFYATESGWMDGWMDVRAVNTHAPQDVQRAQRGAFTFVSVTR